MFVGNLAYSVTAEALKSLFVEVGEVAEVALISRYGRSKGFAFVSFVDASKNAAAVERFNGTDLEGRALNCEIARPKPVILALRSQRRSVSPRTRIPTRRRATSKRKDAKDRASQNRRRTTVPMLKPRKSFKRSPERSPSRRSRSIRKLPTMLLNAQRESASHASASLVMNPSSARQ